MRFFEESEGSETTCIKAFKKKSKKWDMQNGGLHFFIYFQKISRKGEPSGSLMVMANNLIGVG